MTFEAGYNTYMHHCMSAMDMPDMRKGEQPVRGRARASKFRAKLLYIYYTLQRITLRKVERASRGRGMGKTGSGSGRSVGKTGRRELGDTVHGISFRKCLVHLVSRKLARDLKSNV